MKAQPICNCQLLQKQSEKNIRPEFEYMSTKSVPFTTFTIVLLYKIQIVVQTFFYNSEIAFIL